MTNVLRASVTAEAGGTNLCPNPGPAQDVNQWACTNTSTVDFTNAQPDANPIGDPGCGLVTWNGTDALVVPNFSITASSTNTVSLWVYVPDGSPTVHLSADATDGASSGAANVDGWTQITLTWTAAEDDPTITVVPDSTPDPGNDTFYFSGCLIQPGDTVGVYTNGGGQDGDPVQVLVDGSDTPITANGLTGYIPTAGDRLLVQRVGGQMEVVQYLSRGTVPFLEATDLSDLTATVNANTDAIANTASYATATSDTLTNYMSTTDGALAGLQGAYDVLTGLGTAGVEEDYIWVGDDPALSTVKSVQISTYVQAGLYAGDSATLAGYFGLWNQTDIGDITFSGSASPPMTTFYDVFTANGRSALPWNA